MNAPLLPPPARPPHDPYRYRLDRRAGWRGEAHPGLTADVAPAAGDGALTLVALPGSGALLNAADGSFGGLTWPDHLAPLADGGLVLLDRKRGMLRRFDRCACAFRDWPCLADDDPRRPQDPGGIAIACGQLYLADRAGSVMVFSLVSGNLRARWAAPAGFAGWQPQDVAVSGRGEVFVSDPAHGGVHVFSTYGTHRRFFGGLGAVRSLAFDCEDRLHVRIDGAAPVSVLDAASGRVLEQPLRPEAVAGRFPPLPLRVLADGAVDLAGLCVPPPGAPRIFDTAGEPSDAEAPAPAFPPGGVWVSGALDSGIARCTWHRVVLAGSLPQGTRVRVLAWAAESDEPPELLALRPAQSWREAGTWHNREAATREGETDFLLRAAPGRYLWLKLVFEGDGATTPRIAAVEIEFPRISLRRYLPAIFGAEPVAAAFTDRWLAIFDREFRDIETVIDEQARLFDPLACPAAPQGPDFLGWLASWVGVALVRNWPEARRRRYLKHAPRLFVWRGTVHGLRGSLYLFLGLERWLAHRPARADCVPCPVTPPQGWRPPRLLLEHFQLRRWLFLGHARLSDNARLWGERIVNRSRLGGADPDEASAASGAQLGVSQLLKAQDPCRDPFHLYAHKLSVFVPAACIRDPSAARALKRLVELERPAHVAVQIVPVEPRFRVGVQAMLGLDAVIGWCPQPVVLDEGRLGRATVLPGGIDPKPRLRVGVARVGEGSVLP